MTKKEDEINFDNLSYKEFIEKRKIYLQKIYKEEAEKTWKDKKNNIDYNKQSVSYAVSCNFNHW